LAPNDLLFKINQEFAMNEQVKSFIMGKKAPKIGVTPSIALINPKFPHNVGAAIRIASCYGASQVWYTGNRIDLALGEKKRLPREERMKGYQDVDLIQNDYLFDQFPRDVVPVAIEVRKNAEPLHNFVHPENALYVFGPEDGSIPQVYLRHCHRFVVIPTRHCLNLAMAVGTVLYDRTAKALTADESGEFITPGKYEERGKRVGNSEIPAEFQL
jgi:tRNA(Leu) C34 or U34 (ribose-2'-O)-methylase TrmL